MTVGALPDGAILFGALPLAIWLYLVVGRGLFWLLRERDDRDQPEAPPAWPAVVAVVPARDEANVIATSITGLLSQDYPGAFRVILVDDGSTDGTAQAARTAAQIQGAGDRLQVLSGASLSPGWTGKLWAMNQGVEAASRAAPEWLWLTDADIGHAPDLLRMLVARAEAQRLMLASLMVRLHCRTPAERLLIPAFVFFFDMLYPFSWVNDPRRRTAAAAGGCMLVRREALERAGGVAAIRTALIDDCTLGALMKRQGPIWLGLTSRAWSLRPYRTVGEVGRMVSRSAYAQLGYSPVMLLGTLLGLVFTYLAPIGILVLGHGWERWLGLAAWLLMGLAFAPIARFYGRAPWYGLALPVIGAMYAGFTVMSAVQVWLGPGRDVEGASPGARRTRMTAAELRSGKGEGDENFPVASFIIKPQHRAAILAFYRFARTADDVADHPTATPSDKLAHLERMRATLAGESDTNPEALALRRAQVERGLGPEHGLDLLEAFRRDVIQARYDDWDGLMDYCRYSAMPVGRFVLDVHGEDRSTWNASDALCAALQVINHLQDCGKDYRALDRVYVPLDALAARGSSVNALGETAATPALRAVIAGLAHRTGALLARSLPFAGEIRDGRLAFEVAMIQRLAEDLTLRLTRRDPLSERVHHTKAEMGRLAVLAALDRLRPRRRLVAGLEPGR